MKILIETGLHSHVARFFRFPSTGIPNCSFLSQVRYESSYDHVKANETAVSRREGVHFFQVRTYIGHSASAFLYSTAWMTVCA